MTIWVEGGDSRDWDGKGTPPAPGPAFFLGKGTEISGDGYYGFAHYRLIAQFESVLSRGWKFGAWHFHRSGPSPTAAARYYRHYMKMFGLSHFPPILDLEDKYATPGLKLATSAWATCQAIEDAFGEEALIYSAKWYWDPWLKPWLPAGHPIYTRRIWESDPPPDTPEPGYFSKASVAGVQYLLDYKPYWANTKWDFDRFDLVWYALNVHERIL